MRLHGQPDTGAERFWDVDVRLTDQVVELDPEQLDRAGKKGLRQHAHGGPFQARKAIATIAWNSAEAREQCKLYE